MNSARLKSSFTASQFGFSLIEVMVSVGILGIVSVIFATALKYQLDEIQSVGEKLAANDLHSVLLRALPQNRICSYALNNPTPLTFNANQSLPQVLTPTLPIYLSVSADSPPILGPVAAEVGAPASPNSSSLLIQAIQLEILSGSGSTYLGQWRVSFDRNRSVRPVKSLVIPTVLTVDATNPSALSVTSCGDSASTTGPEACPSLLTTDTMIEGAVACLDGREGQLTNPLGIATLFDPSFSSRSLVGAPATLIRLRKNSENRINVYLYNRMVDSRTTLSGSPSATISVSGDESESFLCTLDPRTWICSATLPTRVEGFSECITPGFRGHGCSESRPRSTVQSMPWRVSVTRSGVQLTSSCVFEGSVSGCGGEARGPNSVDTGSVWVH